MGSDLCEYAARVWVEHTGRIFSLRKLGLVCEACVLEKILELMWRRLTREACRAAWSLGADWAFDLVYGLKINRNQISTSSRTAQ